MSSVSIPTVSRPKKPSTAGKPYKIKVNYVEVKKFKYPVVYIYTVGITKKGRPAPKKYHDMVIAKILSERKFGATFPAYYGDRLYSRQDILNNSNSKRIDITVDGEQLTVTVKYTGDIDLREINLGSNKPWDDTIQNTLTVLNAYINTKVRLDPKNLSLSSKSNAIFEREPKTREFLVNGIELMHGFFQSVRPGWDKLFLNVDTCHTTLYPYGNLFTLLPKLLKESPKHRDKTESELDKGLSYREIRNLSYFLKGIKFFTKYNKRKYSIHAISTECANDYKFKNEEEGTMMSVSEYFTKCGEPLKHPKLPCVVVMKKIKGGGQKTLYFPIEVCTIIPGQKFAAEDLSGPQRGDMIRKTAIDPVKRFENVKRALQQIYNHSSNEYLKSIELEADQDLTEFTARIIDEPNMVANGSNGTEIKVIPKKGIWEIEKFKKGASLHNWSVVVFENPEKLKRTDVEAGIGKLIDVLVEKGVKVTNKRPKITYVNGKNSMKYKETGDFETPIIDEALKVGADNAKVKKEEKSRLVVCILNKKSESRDGLYAEIKKICLLKYGVLSQCIQAQNLDTPVFQKLAPKLNTKLGGINSSLLPGEINFKSKKTAMIIGADVYHPGREEKQQGYASVASVCASMDSDAAQYVARYRINEFLNNETIETLSDMVQELLCEFRRRNDYLPEHIIFYRDGVAEVQIEKIMVEEIEVLKESLRQFYGEQKEPKITLLICQKRHHMRCIPVEEEERSMSGNCLTGTIIDSYIVMENEFSFFLLSQAVVPRGTARSTYYRILLNEGNFSAEEIQRLTYNLCFLSARCDMSISQTTPGCYAHLIANQARYLVTFDKVSMFQRGNERGRGGRGRGDRGRGGRGRGRGNNNNVVSPDERRKVKNPGWKRVQEPIENVMWFL